ncbi:methylmalonyl-CoA mutase family protein [Echinicola jeungdonensis]|uniref:Methylmalonyl-CoA mutase family protein n=1 Tax=Echinicola jeungdonensis TaxID=709343 RepID=A0ABV5J7Z7_9BACT|nr:methylmalonyl-CoA mutase family protein [Echinicola jeungdonensis]MDN3669987.1 methylmalonyl-CoA mutase family protein [Echinicola jeungdonensis]
MNKLFDNFPPQNKGMWMQEVLKDLKQGSFEHLMISRPWEGMSLFPFYTAEDAEKWKWLISYENIENYNLPLSSSSPKQWANMVKVTWRPDDTFEAEVKRVLEGGADGIILELSGEEPPGIIFKGDWWKGLVLWIHPLNNPVSILQQFFSEIDQRKIDKGTIVGGILYSPFKNLFDNQKAKSALEGELWQLHQMTKDFQYFKGLCLDWCIYLEGGGNPDQEMRYGLGELVELMDILTEKGFSPEELFKNLIIKVAVSGDFYMEIAKLKSMRVLVHQLAGLYEVKVNPNEFPFFGFTSNWSKSKVEPYTNMIKNTTESLAALLGGCNLIWVRPHEIEGAEPSNFSKRIARNILNILKEECYLDKVLDPTAGSYYLGFLTNKLRQLGEEGLRQLEKEGGWWGNYMDLRIQKDIKTSRMEKWDALISGDQVRVGENKYRAKESGYLLAKKPNKIQEEPFQIKPLSPVLLFEMTKTS